MVLGVTVVLLLCSVSACNKQYTAEVNPAVTEVIIISAEPFPSTEVAANDKPTVPENVAEGMDYLFDFHFSERYGDRVTSDFSLTLPSDNNVDEETIFLLGQLQSNMQQFSEHSYDGDGMVPHMYKRHWYTVETGYSLLLETDFYEPDDVEYISYMWTNIKGTKTSRNVSIGSTEADLLSAYTTDLYYLTRDATEPAVAKYTEDYDAEFNFACAYTWQPYTLKSNDIRDITFYIKDGIITSIEIAEPFELRYVYGYDRVAGLQYADEKRSAL